MFSRLITRSVSVNGQRMIRTPFTASGNQFFSTAKKGGNVKPPAAAATAAAPKTSATSDAASEKEWEELEKYDTDAEMSPSVLKEIEQARIAAKAQYKEIVDKLSDPAQVQSKLSSSKFEVKPTVNISTPAGKLAHALFSTASQCRSLAIVLRDVELILQSFSTIPSFRSVVEGDIEAGDKQTLLEFYIEAMPLSPLGEFFLYHMASEKQFPLIIQTLRDYKRLYASLSTEMTIRLTVAHEYSAAEKQTLEQQVRGYFTEDTKIQFVYTVEPSIKSGYKIDCPLLTHNATLSAAIEKSEREERSIFADFFGDLREAVNTNTAVWEKKEFQDKYFSFDPKAYEESLEKK
eukprot:gene9110-10682_t